MTPLRVVSLVPSITENLIQFGLVPCGRTSFCIEPKDVVASVPTVGGTKTPKIDRIVELHPDLVIANQEENRKQDIEGLRNLGLKVWVTYPRTVDESIVYMEELRDLCPETDKADRILAECRSAVEKVRGSRSMNPARVLTLIWKDPWMAAGSDTYMSDLIETAGGLNPLGPSLGRYPTLTEAEILELAPDVLILPSEPYEFNEHDRKSWSEIFSAVGKKCRVELFSGEDLCWFGPRLPRALEKLTEITSRLSKSS